MDHEFRPALVTSIIQESPRVRRYLFQPETKIPFEPGQFVMLDLPIESKFTNRSYSISSEPRENGDIELCIVLNPEGAGTPYLWNQVKVGSTLQMSKSLGKFLLPEVMPERLFFICTGTGIAPFRSMIRHLLLKGHDLNHITLVFGNRVEEDILYLEEWSEIKKVFPHFVFLPVLSRPTEQWLGLRGYVHEHYMPLLSSGMNALFYLCGWGNMVKEARNNLRELGYGKQEIKFELYD